MPAPNATRPRAWIPVAVLLLLWAAVEIFAWLSTWAIGGAWPDLGAPARVHGELAQRIDTERGDANLEAFALEVIHPYVGFVGNPLLVPSPGSAVPQRNAFGFVDPEGPIREADPGRLRVAILGGSVAERFGPLGGDRFEERLGALLGRPVDLVRLGQSGWKQPQPLMAVAWLLSLGAHYDVLVALDGFNEVALHDNENARQDVAPSYPRGWALRVAGLPDPAALAQRGRVAALDRARLRWAAAFARLPLRVSPAAQVVWRWRDQRLAAERGAAEDWLRAYRPTEARYAVQGPAYFEGEPDDPLGALVRVWERSSLQLHRLAAANGARYFHFLQPNQYFRDAKPMDAAERAIALREDHAYRPGAEAGYPLLLDAGARLRAAGVAFHDATGIFLDTREPIFVDDCCHMNARGHAILGDHIARTIAAELGR